jgi:hypothetical protein
MKVISSAFKDQHRGKTKHSSIIFGSLVILGAVVLASIIISIFGPSVALAQRQPNMTGSTSANATHTATPTLGIPVIEEKGMVTGQRVVEVHPWPKIETSFVQNDTIKGNISASEMGTYTSIVRPDGSLYGQGQGIITTKGGEVVTWTGQGIGHFMQDGKLRFHGSLFFSTNSTTGKLAFLNNMVGIFHYEVDTAGKTIANVWEWK